MRQAIFSAMMILGLAGCNGTLPVGDGEQGLYEVHGVEEGDMLKLRAGPGTGFDILAGLPNGTVLQVRNCERLGQTRWCKVSMNNNARMAGYVSQSYLRKL